MHTGALTQTMLDALGDRRCQHASTARALRRKGMVANWIRLSDRSIYLYLTPLGASVGTVERRRRIAARERDRYESGATNAAARVVDLLAEVDRLQQELAGAPRRAAS